MSGQTIRSVVIQIAIEQKQATLKVPGTSAVTAAIGNMNAAASAGSKKRATDEERAYDKQAAAALSAYSRIMASREQAAEKEKAIATQIASAQSAVIAAYSSGAMAALQMAKGIAFVVAANDEQAESFVRAIAKAQGYFDLAVGGAHIIQQLNNAHRQSIVLMNLQSATAVKSSATTTAVGSSAAAAAGGVGLLSAAVARFTVIGGQVAAAVFTGMTLGVGAVAIAVYAGAKAWIYYGNAAEREAKKAAVAAELSAVRQVSALERFSAFVQESATAQGASPNGGSQSAIESQIAQLQSARATLSAQARQTPAGIDETRAGRESSIKRSLGLQEQGIALMQQEQQLQDQLIEGKKAEQSAAQQILRTAQDTLITEENRNRSENARLGLMSRADQNTAKRLLEKKGRGEELNIRDARKAQSLGILAGDVEAAGVKEAGRLGLTGARERGGETRPLEQARRDLKSAEGSAGEAIKQLDDELKEAAKQQKELAEKLVKTIANKFATTEALQRVIEGIEDVKKENDKKWFL